MGEISFKYMIKNRFRHINTFKYLYSNAIKYSFIYRRYVASSDASIFNGPVAITKVATGLLCLHDLFVDKNAHSVNYKQYLQSSEHEHKGNIDNTSYHVYFPKIFDSIPTTDCFVRDNINHQTMIQHDILFGDEKHYGSIFNTSNNIKHYDVFHANTTTGYFGYEEDYLNRFLKDEIMAGYDLPGIDVNTQINAKYAHDLCMHVFKNYLATPDRISFVILDTFIKATPEIKITEVNKQINTYTDRNSYINVFQTYSAKRESIVGNIYDFYSLILPDKNAIVNDIINTSYVTYNKADVNEILPGTQNNIIGNIYQIYSGSTGDKSLSLQPEYFATTAGKTAQIEPIYSLTGNQKETYVLDLSDFCIKEEKEAPLLNNVSLTKWQEIFNTFDWEPAFKGGKSIRTLGNDIAATDGGNDIKLSADIIDIFQGNKNMNVYNYTESVYKGYHKINTPDKDITVYLDAKDIYLDTGTMLYHDKKDLSLWDEIYQLYKDKYKIYHDKTDISLKKSSGDLTILETFESLFKEKYQLEIWREMFSGTKDNHKLERQNDIISLFKDDKTLELFTDLITFGKRQKPGYKFLEDLWMHKNPGFLERQNLIIPMDKTHYYGNVFQQGLQLIKKHVFLSTTDSETVIKESVPADLLNSICSKYPGLIIPVSKLQKHLYTQRIDTMIQKKQKDGYINGDLTVSVIPKDVMMEYIDLFVDKKSFNTYIEYQNYMITKSKVHAMINESISVDKLAKDSFYQDLITVKETELKAWYEHDIHVDKKPYNGFIDEGINISSIPKETLAKNNGIFIDKLPQLCYYDYGTLFVDEEHLAFIEKQMIALDKLKNNTFLDLMIPVIEKEMHGYYEPGLFASETIMESQLFQQIQMLDKLRKETAIEPNDFGNWAWVYEEPDPFGEAFGIDELLLPERDTRYSDFESIIFDKERMRPKNPVKQIDNTTFIAKYPTKHPIPDYEEIGIVYIDVETSIMHDIYLKFYQIWQSKIFEFGTMTMVQSVKQMLEYLYAWIMVYFPVEQLEQALRVFRQIRWYGETSIIQNSQYIVSYEYDVLQSKLNTGTCHIPNDLDTNDTMIIDANMGVIKNNPAYIGTREANVTFTIDNRKNTKIIFSLSNTVGSVNIYINDTLVDTVSKSALNLTYELPYIGEPSVVKIEKTVANNLNGTFYIGYISVPDCSFKDLSVEFDPTLKMGNKPLNDIARKMIEFANLYEDREKAYEIIRKGNFGVSELYKHLNEYWNLHHKDKIKGKRLTIKEV